MNEVYWTDHMRNFEAYAVMTLWRGAEILRPTIRSLNARELILPAIGARSLLELSSAFNVNTSRVQGLVRNLRFPSDSVVVCEDLEQLIVKMIWGTRFGDPEDYVKQTNALTFLKRVARDGPVPELVPTWEHLCDVAHPSVMGNIRFWSHVEKRYADGSEQRVICRDPDEGPSMDTRDKVLWSLS